MLRDKSELRNHKYDIRIISTHQGLISTHQGLMGKIVQTREILEIICTLDYEIANYFYQNPLNRTPPDDFIRIINLFEARYAEQKLKNWYQSQSNDSKATLFH